MQGIGEILKKAREAKGITLEEVAEATKIRRKYLEAIEQDEFQVLPGEVYARGFVTAYLKYLDIKDQPEVLEIMKPKVSREAQAVQEQLERAEKAAQESIKSVGKRTPQTHSLSSRKKPSSVSFEEKPMSKKGSLIVILSILALALLLLVQWGYSRSQQPEVPQDTIQQEQQAEDPAQQEAAPEQEPAAAPEPEVKTYDSLEMTLEILDANAGKEDQCWMQVTADGKKTELTLSEGQVQEVRAAQQIDLNLGNAGVVKVTVNGQDLGTLGGQGEVVKKSFRLEDYQTSAQ